ncbi:DNA polymerase III subunit gamma/tau [Aminobacter sp. SR38]|jgi:DNA polymerase-3 subunit gamma/tau|uniref:DNA polymerase III subunit gamma/tau n=1 Tax=Aminobacter TaxID=31988 RepID=UPI001783A866|nr:DNA polymerase III subunit gamma/tau [Aminobacter sp. SR38]QOF73457.1 DNA polymerase III subunit gamma/tau [Aminobacter sp. SR38]
MSEAGQTDKTKDGAYRVLARKYRPADFTALVGQEPMVQTLTNAFSSGRIAQAWMLTGVRGVGKTTTARILARALNYKTADIDRPSVDLSVLGEHCQSIMEGRHVDVIEMDAASHTGIDDIRDIIDRVRYAPVSARYKVYIIDEVHMLSTQAFNGLLKTLEEPPPHVKFIFATTEIRKVPITVLSRCQRFDLRRIDAGKLVGHLRNIARQEGISVEDDALAMVARAAEGSARDSLSILDQAIAHGGGTVTTEAVRAMLGLADRARVVDLFENIMKGDIAAALGELRAQYDTGADPVAVLNDLAEFTHLVTRLRFVPSAADDASLSEDERKRGVEFAQALSVRVLSRAWQMLLKGIPEVQSSNRPVSAAEMVLIRLAHAADLPTLDEALKSLGDAPPQPSGAPRNGGMPAGGGNGGGASAVSQARMPVSNGGGQAMRLVESAPAPTAFVAPTPAPEPVVDVVPVRTIAELANLAEANREMAFKVLIRRAVRPVRIEPGHIECSLTSDAPRTFLNDLTVKLKAWTGRHWMVSLSKEEGGPTLAEIEATKREVALTDAKADPTVAAILARFPGAKIIDVRLPTTPDAPDIDTDTELQPDPGIGLDNDDDDPF